MDLINYALNIENVLGKTEFLQQQQNILYNINKIDNKDISFDLSDEDFIKKASYFILSNELQNQRTVNYKKLIKNLDSKILKQFIISIVKNISVKDGKVTSICFQNGITQKFIYRDN